MLFESSSPSAIRSVKQRELLNTWLRLRRDTWGFPPIDDFHPARLEEERKDLVYYVVRKEEESWRFFIDSNGSTAAQAYGTASTNNIGTELAEYLPRDMRPIVLPLYCECASRQLPVFSISRNEDVNGHAVIYERLLMPFFTNGNVTHLLASLKAISEDGKFELNGLLRNRKKLPEYHLRTVIDRELSFERIRRETMERSLGNGLCSDSDVIEI